MQRMIMCGCVYSNVMYFSRGECHVVGSQSLRLYFL